MANLSFDVDKIMEKVTSDALDVMKRKFIAEINRIAAPFGEKPRITFARKGPDSLDVKVDVNSSELRKKIDDYLRS